MTRLRRSQERVDDQREEIAQLRQELVTLRAATKRGEPPASDARKAIPAKRAKSAEGGKIALNQATFEELRELGLSVTQSARLIAYRETRGHFASTDDLAAVPGFAKETISQLRSHVSDIPG